MIDEQMLTKLNKLDLEHYESVAIGDMLFYAANVDIKSGYFIKAMIKVIIRALFGANSFEIYGNPQTLFLFSNSYADRDDLKKSFNQVRELSKNHLFMYGAKNNNIHLYGLKELFVLFKWNKDLTHIIQDRDLRWYVLQLLFKIYMDYREYVDFVEKNNYHIDNILTLCDVHSVDFYFTKKFLSEGKKTVTVQHGIFSSTSDAWSYSASLSEYFLTNGEFSRQEGILSGKKASELYSVGLLSFVNVNDLGERKVFNNEKIGVLLEGELCHEDNINLIKFMQEFCSKNNKEMYLKLHPISKIEDYEDVIDKDICKNIYGKETSLLEFCDFIDVAIIRNSTCFLEMVMKLIPAFLFWEDGQLLEVYRNVKDLRFTTEEELLKLVEQVKEENYADKMKEWRKYYCAGDNPTENYLKIFQQIGIN